MMTELAPAAVALTTSSLSASVDSEVVSGVDSKVDGQVQSLTTEAELVVSDALAMIDGSRIPLLVFVNSRSGGQQGKPLLAQFTSWLGPDQVLDSTLDLPEPLAASQPAPDLSRTPGTRTGDRPRQNEAGGCTAPLRRGRGAARARVRRQRSTVKSGLSSQQPTRPPTAPEAQPSALRRTSGP